MLLIAKTYLNKIDSLAKTDRLICNTIQSDNRVRGYGFGRLPDRTGPRRRTDMCRTPNDGNFVCKRLFWLVFFKRSQKQNKNLVTRIPILKKTQMVF